MQLIEGIETGMQGRLGERFAVRSSMGCGGWAKVPWLVVSDPEESTQHGLYLQYLFAADSSAVYLALGQARRPTFAKFAKFAVNDTSTSRWDHLPNMGRAPRSSRRRWARPY